MPEPVSELDLDRMIVRSLKPRFAEAIFRGTKTIELRRTRPKIAVLIRVLFYATSPVRALPDTCVITTVNTYALVGATIRNASFLLVESLLSKA